MICLLKYWRPLLLLAAIAGAFLTGWVQAGRQCRAEQLQAQVSSLKKQLDISRKAHDDAVVRSMAREAENATLIKEVESYEDELESRSDPACLLSPDDARRLLEIQ